SDVDVHQSFPPPRLLPDIREEISRLSDAPPPSAPFIRPAPPCTKETLMTRVAVTTPYFDFFPKLKAELEGLYPGVKFRTDREPLSEDRLIAFLQGCDAAVIGLDRFTDRVCANLPDLK